MNRPGGEPRPADEQARMTSVAGAKGGAASFLSNRWLQLAAGIVGMVAVANFQYAWTWFIGPLEQRFGWSRVQVLDAQRWFFLLAQTWLVPLEGYLAERFGPRRLLLLGGFLAGLSWVICSRTDSLAVLYASQVLGGCGSGIVYSLSMGSALKWFPDRRGLAAGLTAAAFGTGAAVTVRPIVWTIQSHGYEAAFRWFGIGQGLVIVLAALVIRFPRDGEAPGPARPKVLHSRRDFTPREMLRAPAFWILYAMMTLGAIPGVLMMGQLQPMARDFGIAGETVTLLWVASAAPLLAQQLDQIMSGLTRPAFGWLSDHVGREVAIFLAFALEGTSVLLLMRFGHDPLGFVLTSGLAFFGWGAIFSLFPAVSGDLFGRSFATTNYGLLYTAKGTSSLLASFCDRLHAGTGSWAPVFGLMIAADWLAGLTALFVLWPLRQRSTTGSPS